MFAFTDNVFFSSVVILLRLDNFFEFLYNSLSIFLHSKQPGIKKYKRVLFPTVIEALNFAY